MRSVAITLVVLVIAGVWFDFSLGLLLNVLLAEPSNLSFAPGTDFSMAALEDLVHLREVNKGGVQLGPPICRIRHDPVILGLNGREI